MLWGCTVTPFATCQSSADSDAGIATIEPDAPITRCENCFAYINPLCQVRVRWWLCSLCGHRNHVSSERNSRLRMNGPELSHNLVEYVVPLRSHGVAYVADDETRTSDTRRGDQTFKLSDYEVPTSQHPPIFIALVDETADPSTIDCVSSALEVFVSSAPEEARFGLVTFSDRLGLFDLQQARQSSIDSIGLPHVVYLSLGRIVLPDKHAEARGALPTFEEPDFEDNGDADAGLVVATDILEIDELLVPLDRDNGVPAARAALRCLADEAARRAGERTAPAQCLGLALGRVLGLLLDNPGKGQRLGNRRLDFCGAKIMCFVSSPCSHGPGAVTIPIAPRSNTGNDNSEWAYVHGACAIPTSKSEAGRAASEIYGLLGEKAALGGVSVDLFAMYSRRDMQIGLALTSSLPRLSGGLLRCYEIWRGDRHNEVSERLRADLKGLATRSIAWRGALRLRTSPDAATTCNEAYGSMCVDPFGSFGSGSSNLNGTGGGKAVGSGGSGGGGVDESDSSSGDALYHVAACDPAQTIAFGFEFGLGITSALGVETEDSHHGETVIQIAFAYTCLVEEIAPPKTDGDISTTSERFCVRRLRVYTISVPRTSTPRKMLAGVDLDATLLLLAHKVNYEKHASGIAEARLLLRDWLVRVALSAAKVRAAIDSARKSNNGHEGSKALSPAALAAAHVEETFGESLAMLAPYIYGLLRGSLLGDGSSDGCNLGRAGLVSGKGQPQRRQEGSNEPYELDRHALAEAQLCAGTSTDTRKSIYPDLVAVVSLGINDNSDIDENDDGSDGNDKASRCSRGSNRKKGTKTDHRFAVARRAEQLRRSKEKCLWGDLLRLSRSAISNSAPKALLLDTGFNLCLYYPWETVQQASTQKEEEGGDGNSFPFPPPDTCEVMTCIENKARSSRTQSRIFVCRAVRSFSLNKTLYQILNFISQLCLILTGHRRSKVL